MGPSSARRHSRGRRDAAPPRRRKFGGAASRRPLPLLLAHATRLDEVERWGHRRRDGTQEGGGTLPLHAGASLEGRRLAALFLSSSLTPPGWTRFRDGAIVGVTALKRAAGRRPSTPAQAWRGGVSPPSSCPLRSRHQAWTRFRDGAIVGVTARKRAAGRRPSTPGEKNSGGYAT